MTSLLVHGARDEVDAPTGTGSAATRWLGIVTLVGMAAFVVLGLWLSPEDVVQNDLVRMFYVHVPVATVSFTACFITGLGSVMFLWRKSWWWDTLAYASAELAALFTVFTLVTGSLWGRPAWGTYWEWDARLTSTALLMLLLLGYLALHKAPAPAENQAKRAAIVGLLLVPNVLIVRQSVDWWRSLHQRATINLLGNTQIAGVMLFTFFVGLIVMSCAFLWLLIHRFRVAWLEHEVDAVDLADAIVERRAGGRVNTGYILAAWTVVLGGLALYAVVTIARGRRLARRVPPERRRWADTEQETHRMTFSTYDDADSTPDAGEMPELDLTPRPPREKRSTGRVYLVAIVLVLVIVGGFFAVKALGSATLYFYQANEAVANKDQLGTKRFRMLGNVEQNTIQSTGTGVDFTVDYDDVAVKVRHVGDPPQLFKSGAPVVLEGHWSDDQTVFLSDTILVKHTEDYVQKNPDRKTSADTSP